MRKQAGRVTMGMGFESLEQRKLLAVVASAGGPYVIEEGESLLLSANESSSDAGNDLAFQWDLDGDGDFDDAVGVSVGLTWRDIQTIAPMMGNGVSTISVRADDGKEIATATTTVTVQNLAPVLTSLSVPQVVQAGTEVGFEAEVTDAGRDMLTYEWNFGDGQTESGFDLSATRHTFTSPGVYGLSVAVTDGDGGSIVELASTVAISAGPVIIYNAGTGEIQLDGPELDSLTLLSSRGSFSGEVISEAEEQVAAKTVNRITLSDPVGFALENVGVVAESGLTEAELLDDLTVYARSSSGKVFDSIRVVWTDESDITLAYDSTTGELFAHSEQSLTTLEIKSSSGVFDAVRPSFFESEFDVYRPDKLFIVTPNGAGTKMEFGPAISPDLPLDLLRDDLSIAGSVLPSGGLESTNIVGVNLATITTNSPPIAVTPPTYQVIEGDDFTLDASDSVDIDSAEVVATWDLDDDGVFDDAVGMTPIVAWASSSSIDNDGIFPVAVKVSDGVNDDVAFSVINVVNANPTAVADVIDIPSDSKEPTEGNLLLNDSDPVDQLVVSSVNGDIDFATATAGQFGELAWTPGGQYSYRIDGLSEELTSLKEGDTLVDVFTYEITDGDGGFATSSLTVTITGAPEPVYGDVNLDGIVDVEDVNLACSQVNRNEVVDILELVFGTRNSGDVNLDGYFDTTDLVQLFSAGRYESFEGALWSQGDVNCDGYFDTTDLLTMFRFGDFETGQPTFISPSFENQPLANLNTICGIADPSSWAYRPEDRTAATLGSKFMFYYDHNRDGTIELDDVDFALTSIDWIFGDYTFDGVLDLDDLTLLREQIDAQPEDQYPTHCSDAVDSMPGVFELATLLEESGFQVFDPFDFDRDFHTAPHQGADERTIDEPLQDLSIVCRAVVAGIHETRFDVDSDGSTDYRDVQMAADLMGIIIGDLFGGQFGVGRDGKVDELDIEYFTDFNSFFSDRRKDGAHLEFGEGDLNCDGVATQEDVDIAIANFNAE